MHAHACTHEASVRCRIICSDIISCNNLPRIQSLIPLGYNLVIPHLFIFFDVSFASSLALRLISSDSSKLSITKLGYNLARKVSVDVLYKVWGSINQHLYSLLNLCPGHCPQTNVLPCCFHTISFNQGVMRWTSILVLIWSELHV